MYVRILHISNVSLKHRSAELIFSSIVYQLADEDEDEDDNSSFERQALRNRAMILFHGACSTGHSVIVSHCQWLWLLNCEKTLCISHLACLAQRYFDMMRGLILKKCRPVCNN